MRHRSAKERREIHFNHGGFGGVMWLTAYLILTKKYHIARPKLSVMSVSPPCAVRNPAEERSNLVANDREDSRTPPIDSRLSLTQAGKVIAWPGQSPAYDDLLLLPMLTIRKASYESIAVIDASYPSFSSASIFLTSPSQYPS